MVAGSGVRCDALHHDVRRRERERSFENTRQNASDTGIAAAALERQEVGRVSTEALAGGEKLVV